MAQPLFDSVARPNARGVALNAGNVGETGAVSAAPAPAKSSRADGLPCALGFNMTHPLTTQEERLFNKLRSRADFAAGLYSDGVPDPETYCGQHRRVVFVFREPNLQGESRDLDMREQIRGSTPAIIGRPRGWWRNKVGALAHAVLAAQAGDEVASSFAAFEEYRDRAGSGHPCPQLHRFGFVQVKKTGGTGTQVATEVVRFARDHGDVLAEQLDIYSPTVVIGCGVGAGSPARLLLETPLGRRFSNAPALTANGLSWWRATEAGSIQALLEIRHPSARVSRESMYRDLYAAYTEVSSAITE